MTDAGILIEKEEPAGQVGILSLQVKFAASTINKVPVHLHPIPMHPNLMVPLYLQKIEVTEGCVL